MLPSSRCCSGQSPVHRVLVPSAVPAEDALLSPAAARTSQRRQRSAQHPAPARRKRRRSGGGARRTASPGQAGHHGKRSVPRSLLPACSAPHPPGPKCALTQMCCCCCCLQAGSTMDWGKENPLPVSALEG
eukprot:3663580-Rhodomonas_salina.1